MVQVDKSVSDLGLKDLAEPHLKRALDRIGKLVEHEDAQVALQASLLVVVLARPQGAAAGGFTLPKDWGVPNWGQWGPWGPFGPWGGQWGGGGRAG